jgi:hypothetical protein
MKNWQSTLTTGTIYLDTVVLFLWIPIIFVAPETRFSLPILALMALRLLHFFFFESEGKIWRLTQVPRVYLLSIVGTGLAFVIFQTLVDNGYFYFGRYD